MSLSSLDQYMMTADYIGPDPYDGLNSPLAVLALSKSLRQILVQVNKRSPLDLHRLLCIAPLRMSKTLGLVLSSFATASREFDQVDVRTRELRSQLLDQRNADNAWGYEFDVQLRWGRYPQGVSNIIATSFASEGLLATAGAKDSTDWQEGVANWIESSLQHEGYITYSPTTKRLIHNANLLGAMTLANCKGRCDLVTSALDATLATQSPSGAFSYGDQSTTSWIDSFHTAYILLALRRLRMYYPEVDGALNRGLDFWLEQCFDENGAAKYFATDSVSTDDAHTNATALLTLCAFSENCEVERRLELFVPSYLSRLNSSGFFTNRRSGKPYMRWELAHQLRALAELVGYLEREASGVC